MIGSQDQAAILTGCWKTSFRWISFNVLIFKEKLFYPKKNRHEKIHSPIPLTKCNVVYECNSSRHNENELLNTSILVNRSSMHCEFDEQNHSRWEPVRNKFNSLTCPRANFKKKLQLIRPVILPKFAWFGKFVAKSRRLFFYFHSNWRWRHITWAWGAKHNWPNWPWMPRIVAGFISNFEYLVNIQEKGMYAVGVLS